MRWTLPSLLLALLAAGPSGAAPIAFQAELAIVFSQGGLGTIAATASGSTDVDPTTLQFSLPAGLFALSGTVAGPGSGSVAALRVQGGNAFGWPRGGMIGANIFIPAALPLSGSLELALVGGGTLVLPLSVLGGPLLTDSTSATTPSGLHVRLRGARWDLAAVVGPIGVPTSTPLPTGTLVGLPGSIAHGTDTRNASGVGRLQLVTPVNIALNGDPTSDLSGYGRLTIDFVPEPAPLGLLAFGVAGLAVASRRPSRRR